jgi:NADPH-dependent 2,4-dienoyl-CoA reductase/sulfur reductase-like enzyme
MREDERMPAPSRIVIIGGSLAGATAAVTLRENGFDGEVTLVGAEAHLPYERPPLSKALLLGETDEPDWVADADYYRDHGISLVRGTTATAVRPADHLVAAGGRDLPYDKLLLATGSTPRRLDLPGATLGGVLTLRTLDDALDLRARLEGAPRLVVVGAGWIGCEVAAAARTRGASVTVVEPEPQPLLRVLGDRIGGVFADLHRDHGVDLRLGSGVSAFEGNEVVSGVRLGGDQVVPADLVVVGIGVRANVDLAADAGLELAAGGVAVDATLRTSHPEVYAVGDIAAHDHPRYPERVRVEHWANAKDQGAHVAANLLGAELPYEKRPFFFSDQYDLGCEYRGLADPARDRLVVRGDEAAREFIAFWLRDGAVAAALNVNSWDDGDALQDLVDSGRAVDEEALRTGTL